MQRKRIIGVDFDDVLMDFSPTLYTYHNMCAGTSFERKHAISFNLWEVWGGTPEQAKQRVLDFYETEIHWEAPPVEDSQFGIALLKKNHSLVIITSRPIEHESKVTSWLDRHFPNLFDHVFFTNLFHGENKKILKSEACKSLNVDVFIDDHIENTLDVAENGTDAFLFDSPWNQNFPKHPKITRVHGWKDIVSRLAPDMKN